MYVPLVICTFRFEVTIPHITLSSLSKVITLHILRKLCVNAKLLKIMTKLKLQIFKKENIFSFLYGISRYSKFCMLLKVVVKVENIKFYAMSFNQLHISTLKCKCLIWLQYKAYLRIIRIAYNYKMKGGLCSLEMVTSEKLYLNWSESLTFSCLQCFSFDLNTKTRIYSWLLDSINQ